MQFSVKKNPRRRRKKKNTKFNQVVNLIATVEQIVRGRRTE
jgi:hypothetical protein